MTQAAILAASGSPGTTTGFKNKIINGNMVISQYNGTSSITPTDGQFIIDRFQLRNSQTSKFTAQQNAGSVTPPAGFTNYLGLTSTSAYSVVSSDYFMIRQSIEGFNFADCNWGTANAKTVTLSFWVRSSLTGTFGGALQNSANDRAYPFTYTISSANTWTQASVTIAGDTTGTWVGATNGTGLILNLAVGVGSNFTTTAGSWAAGNYFSATGAVSVVGTSGATFYITGVQLEVGTTATNFDFRSYGTELQLCQRYCYVIRGTSGSSPFIGSGWWDSSTANRATATFPVVMRSAPSIFYSSLSDLAALQVNVSWNAVTSVVLTSENSIYSAGLSVASTGGTQGQSSVFKVNVASATAYFGFSAEL